MKYKKDNKLPNTKNVRRKTNPAGVTTIIEPKKNAAGGGGGGAAPGAGAGTNTNSNQSTTGGGGGGGGAGSEDGLGSSPGYAAPLPHLPPGSLKQEPGQYGLTSL